MPDAPLEAQAWLKRFRPKKSKRRTSSAVPYSNTETRLWRHLRGDYGKPFNAARYMSLCRLACRTFAINAVQADVMRNFAPTWKTFLQSSSSYHEYDWIMQVIHLLREEVRNSCHFPTFDPDTFRQTGYYHLPLVKWFPEKGSRKSVVTKRIMVIKAAQRCGLSPLNLLIDHNLVNVSVLRRA